MKCPKCGFENVEGANICKQCGCSLDAGELCGTPSKTSGMALTSFICALLAPLTCMISGVVGLILGIVALVKINKNKDRLKGNGFAITGIALSAMWIFILPLLMAILMPALGRARQCAMQEVSKVNLQSLSIAVMVYANENDDQFPAAQWCDLLIQEADVNEKQFLHPNDYADSSKGNRSSYAYNKNLIGMEALQVPGNVVLIFESQKGWNQVGGPEILSTEYNNGRGVNVTFTDGHVEFVSSDDIDDLVWSVEEPAGVE